MSARNLKITCWSIAAIWSLMILIAAIRFPANMTIDHDNILIKYAGLIFIGNCVALMLIFPFLIEKGIITGNYNNEEKVVKAKTDFIIYSIVSPGIILVFLAIFIGAVKVSIPFATICFLAFLYKWLGGFYITTYGNNN